MTQLMKRGKTEAVTLSQVDRHSESIDEKDFTVRCLSSALLEGASLSPTTLLAAARRVYTSIYHQDAPSLPDIKMQDQRVEFEAFSGFSLKSNRRRSIEPAMAAGSVFRYISPVNADLRKALSVPEYGNRTV